jgi:hypothetical protein
MVHNPWLYFYDRLSGALPARNGAAVRPKFLFASADVGESCARFGLALLVHDMQVGIVSQIKAPRRWPCKLRA